MIFVYIGTRTDFSASLSLPIIFVLKCYAHLPISIQYLYKKKRIKNLNDLSHSKSIWVVFMRFWWNHTLFQCVFTSFSILSRLNGTWNENIVQITEKERMLFVNGTLFSLVFQNEKKERSRLYNPATLGLNIQNILMIEFYLPFSLPRRLFIALAAMCLNISLVIWRWIFKIFAIIFMEIRNEEMKKVNEYVRYALVQISEQILFVVLLWNAWPIVLLQLKLHFVTEMKIYGAMSTFFPYS